MVQLLLLLLWLPDPSWGAVSSPQLSQTKPEQPTLRRDLLQSLGDTLCRSEQSPRPPELWSQGIFDTHIETTWITSREALEPDEIRDAARQEARLRQHQGYAFALCSERRAWILSTAAPRPPLVPEGAVLQFDAPALAPRCRSFDIDHAAALGGKPKVIARKRSVKGAALQINTAFLEAGTLAITCHSPQPQVEGPVLWALAPIGQWDRSNIPHFFPPEHNTLPGLMQWIQDLRIRHGLKALQQGDPMLQRVAAELSKEPSLRHPRPLLRKKRRELSERGAQLLGENRVRAVRIPDMAWLLWFSPQHRALLLNPDANALGTELAALEDEKLLVLVLAKI